MGPNLLQNFPTFICVSLLKFLYFFMWGYGMTFMRVKTNIAKVVNQNMPWSFSPVDSEVQQIWIKNNLQIKKLHVICLVPPQIFCCKCPYPYLREKSNFHPRTIAKVWFLTFNYETRQHRSSNCQNRANLAFGVVLYFLKKFK